MCKFLTVERRRTEPTTSTKLVLPLLQSLESITQREHTGRSNDKYGHGGPSLKNHYISNHPPSLPTKI